MAQLNKIRRKISRDKGKSYELNDPEPCFLVRYVGMRTVSADFGKSSNLEMGIELSSKCVAETEKDQDAAQKVSLLISTNIARGLAVIDWETKKEQVTFQLQEIAFCTTDERMPTMFSFIANHDGILECHVFDCEKEGRANEICEALTSAFTTAHDNWSRTKKRSEERKKSRDLTMTLDFSKAGRGLEGNSYGILKDEQD